MSSYWPETSRPETSQQSSSYPEDECITQLEAEGAPLPLARLQHPYTPRVNDLVIASPRLLRADRTNIPPSFKQSEAVDSSVLIGHGASFNVTRQAIPRDRDSVIDSLTLGKLVTIKMLSQLQKRPRYVVYKSPRIAFEPNGEPSSSQDRRALESVLTELHALLHHPLRYHANIIDLIGVAWGRNHANLSQQLPALIVEYGDRGTLADVQIGKDALSEQLKSQITLEIASGLQALHEENIVHGDLKPENIIMCSDSENILVPKLADFGFSIIEAAGTLNIMLGGSRTWRAPESYSRLAISMLKFTDIYSFGLVVWSIALDGENPFNTLLPKSLQSETRLLAQDRLKNQDKLRPLLKFEQWLNRWQTLKSAPTCKVCDLETESYALGTDLNDDPSHLLQRCDEYTASITALGQRQKRFYCFLEDVLDCTLSVHHPLERDLGRTIELCENGMVVEVITQSSDLSIQTPPSPGRSLSNMSIELVKARAVEPDRPHSVMTAEDIDNAEGGPCPTFIRIQLFAGKSAEEFRSIIGRRVDLMVLQASHPALGTTTNWSSVPFYLEYGTVDEDGLISRPFEMAYCIPEGYGLDFNIPKRRQRLLLRLNCMNHHDALT